MQKDNLGKQIMDAIRFKNIADDCISHAAGSITIVVRQMNEAENMEGSNIEIDQHANGAAVMAAAFALINKMTMETSLTFNELIGVLKSIDEMKRYDGTAADGDQGEGVEHPAG